VVGTPARRQRSAAAYVKRPDVRRAVGLGPAECWRLSRLRV